MRLWSLDSYKCMEEYSLPDAASLVDFDFDESKVKPPQVHSCVKLTLVMDVSATFNENCSLVEVEMRGFNEQWCYIILS